MSFKLRRHASRILSAEEWRPKWGTTELQHVSNNSTEALAGKMKKWGNSTSSLVSPPCTSEHLYWLNFFQPYNFFEDSIHFLVSIQWILNTLFYSWTFRRAISFVAEVSRKPSLARYLHDRTKSIRDAEARKTGTTGRVAKRMQSWIGF